MEEPEPSNQPPRVTPRDLMARSRANNSSEVTPLNDVLVNLSSHYPEIIKFLRGLGVDVREEVENWIAESGNARVNAFLRPNLESWKFFDLVDQQKLASLVECLIVEEVLYQRLGEVGPYIRVSKVVESYYLSAAKALYKKLGGNKQDVPETTLAKLASTTRLAYDRVVANDPNPPKRILAERAASAIALSRFADLAYEELFEVVDELRLLATEPELDWTISYFVEGACALFDLRPDPRLLTRDVQRAVELYGASKKTSAISCLNFSEAFIRLAGEAGAPERRIEILGKAESWLSREWSDREEFNQVLVLRETMNRIAIQALITSDTSAVGSFRGVSFPFCFRKPRDSMMTVLDVIGPAILEEIGESSEYIYRDVCSSISSFLATNRLLDLSERIRFLNQSDVLRRAKPGQQKKLIGSRYELDAARDLALLSELTASKDARNRAIQAWYMQWNDETNKVEARSSLAWEIKNNGAAPEVTGIRDAFVLSAIRTGNWKQLFKSAAEAALTNLTGRTEALGGRGSSDVIYMSRNGRSQALVYKTNKTETLDWAERRSTAVKKQTEKFGLGRIFKTPEFLSRIEIKDADTGESVSVRTFLSAPTLSSFAAQSVETPLPTIESVAKYLALIHSVDLEDSPTTGIRNSYKNRLNRWLKKLTTEDQAARLFDEWWSFVATAPIVTKRDAHGNNWLVDPDGAIVALDLDSKEPTFIGDEVAQLLYDPPVLDTSDLARAFELFNAYLENLREFGWHGDLHLVDADRYFLAGLCFRAVNFLTDPKSPAKSEAGEALLAAIAKTDAVEIANWANKVHELWQVKRGAKLSAGTKQLHKADRARMSKSIAYHLRHNEEAPIDSHGWMHVDDLVELMQGSGYAASVSDLIAIAGAQGEKRFELAGNGYEIRASYGHSLGVKLDLSESKMPEVLFHATSTKNLDSIVRAKTGLQRGKRIHVHLSSNPTLAYESALRFGDPVVIFAIRTLDLKTPAFRANSNSETWLTDQVPLDALRIFTLPRFVDAMSAKRDLPESSY